MVEAQECAWDVSKSPAKQDEGISIHEWDYLKKKLQFIEISEIRYMKNENYAEYKGVIVGVGHF